MLARNETLLPVDFFWFSEDTVLVLLVERNPKLLTNKLKIVCLSSNGTLHELACERGIFLTILLDHMYTFFKPC